MKRSQLFFLIVLLGLLALPWFNLPQPHIAGVEKETALPRFSWKTYWTGAFQKQFEAWWNGHYGSRRSLLIVKNDIYDVLNFGQFHAGSSRQILQGKAGTLYEEGYIVRKFTLYSDAQIQKNAADTVAVFSELRDRLAYMGKDFLFIMAPNKADAREESLPALWQFRAKHAPVTPTKYHIWEKELSAKNIVHVNTLALLQQKNMLRDSFPDTGTHWSMLAAGTAWEEGISKLRAAGSALPSVHITGETVSDKAYAAERDIANLLNLRPQYHEGKPTWKRATYRPVPAEHAVNTFCLGDSFSVQLRLNILQSGFSTEESISWFENRMPTKKQWFDLLGNTDLIVLTYTSLKLEEPRMKNEAGRLLEYMKDLITENWHSYEDKGKGQWSRQTSRVSFFHSSDTDYEFSFSLTQRFHSTSLRLSVNGHEIRTMDLKSMNLPAKVNVFIPRSYLQRGLNTIEFFVKDAAAPVAVTENSNDKRLLGVFCSDFRLDPQK